MFRTILAGLLAVTVAVTPAFAAQKKSARKPVKKVVRQSISDFEREAWGDTTPKKTVKKVTKKPAVAKTKKPAEQATVTLRGGTKPPVAVVKPVEPGKAEPPKTEVKPDETKPETVASADKKSEEELEKEAREQKDPKKALAAYNELLERNPNYQYAGDAYKNMFQMSQRGGADTLTQLTLAGKAAQNLQQGRSRGPVNPQEVQKLNKATDDLIQRWIEETTRQILSEAGKK
jgi:hypothetical protein